jgi:hypothetical protein
MPESPVRNVIAPVRARRFRASSRVLRGSSTDRFARLGDLEYRGQFAGATALLLKTSMPLWALWRLEHSER